MWEGWVRLGTPPPVPHASLYSCSAVCLSGSTLDASAAGPWFDSGCPSRPSSGSGKGTQRVGWQPPMKRGRWWGALLQVAGFLFALRICDHTRVFCSGPSGSGEKNQKREGSQSPVGRGRWEEALLQARLEPAIYATTANDGNHYTTLPPLHVAQLHGVSTGLFPRSITYALWTSPHCVPLFLPAFHKRGRSGRPVRLNPPWSSNPPLRVGRIVASRYAMKRWVSLPNTYIQHTNKVLPHASPGSGIGPRGPRTRQPGVRPRTRTNARMPPPPLLVLRYCYY